MKHKIVKTEGCLSFGLTIDDKNIEDIPKVELNKIVDYLCEKMKEGLDDGTVVFSDIVNVFQYSDYGSDEHSCETCGDTVHWCIWEI
jgi:hypothetical protein